MAGFDQDPVGRHGDVIGHDFVGPYSRMPEVDALYAAFDGAVGASYAEITPHPFVAPKEMSIADAHAIADAREARRAPEVQPTPEKKLQGRGGQIAMADTLSIAS